MPQARAAVRQTGGRTPLGLVQPGKHLLIEKPSPLRPLEFDIPHEASEYGELDLAWWGEPGLGGSGRKYQVSEVWLIKK